MTKKFALLLLMSVAISRNCGASQSVQPDSGQTSKLQGAPQAAKASSAKVYHVGGDVKAPRIIKSVQPQADQQQSMKLAAGKTAAKVRTVILEIVIEEDGTVRSAQIAQSSHDHDLDAKAIDAARQWTFEPATKRGVPVAVQFAIRIDFRLYK
jgi:protein TonB